MKRIPLGSVCSLVVAFALSSFLGVAHTQSLPAPTVDRVGFPAGYKDTYRLFYTFDNYQNRQIRRVYANEIAASVKPGETFNFPYGSILLFESYGVQLDSRGEPVLDLNGRFVPTALTTIFVMRRSAALAPITGNCGTASGNTLRIGRTEPTTRPPKTPAHVRYAI